jgi:hypothetical protein
MDMICVVVFIIKTGKRLRLLARQPKNQGLISSSDAKILSSSSLPERLWWGSPGVKVATPAGWHNGIALDTYSGGDRFESRLVDRQT